MKQAIDFFPIIIFAAAFYLYRDLILATKVLIAATALQVIAHYLLYKTVEKMHLITFGVVAILGGATVFFQDEHFVKWKPTAIYWIFAAVLLVSQFVGEKNITQRLLGGLIDKVNQAEDKVHELAHHEAHIEHPLPSSLVPKSLWLKLNLAWVIFFSLLGILNIYIAYHFSNEIWVNFKLFGVTAANMLFFFMQLPFLIKYFPKEDSQQ